MLYAKQCFKIISIKHFFLCFFQFCLPNEGQASGFEIITDILPQSACVCADIRVGVCLADTYSFTDATASNTLSIPLFDTSSDSLLCADFLVHCIRKKMIGHVPPVGFSCIKMQLTDIRMKQLLHK